MAARTTTLHLPLTPELQEALSEESHKRGIQMPSLVRSVLEKWLAGRSTADLDPHVEATSTEGSSSRDVGRLWDLVEAGQATWSGGKPKGSARPVKVRGKSLSEMVLEDRR